MAIQTSFRNETRSHNDRKDQQQNLRSIQSQATEALIRKVLCPQAQGGQNEPHTPIDELLPPLTSSNAVDIHLYAIIAIIMRDFVYSWYGKITPDQSFIDETIRIIAHCTRELEQRLQRVDLTVLLLDEIPKIVSVHVDSYKTAHKQQGIPTSSDPETLYHALFPHPALSPAPEHALSTVEQIKNEAAYRQLLVQGTLAVLLPCDDLRNPCLRTLVSDVIADMILGNGIGSKASAGWLIWDGLAKALEQADTKVLHNLSAEKTKHLASPRLEQFGLVSSSENPKASTKSIQTPKHRGLSAIFWNTMQSVYLLILAIRFILVGLYTASKQSATSKDLKSKSGADTSEISPIASRLEPLSFSTIRSQPFLTYSIFASASQLLELPTRKPWLLGCMSLIQHHLTDGVLRIAATGGILDKFLQNTIHQLLYRADNLPQILQIVRAGIFPNNALGPPRSIPSLEEQRLIKRRAAVAILQHIPPIVASQYLASNTDRQNTETLPRSYSRSLAEKVHPDTSDLQIPNIEEKREDQLQDIELILDIFGNQYMNKHLLYSVIELVIVRLIPELQSKSVKELIYERLGSSR